MSLSPSAGDYVTPRRTGRAGVIAVEACSRRAYGRHSHDEFGIGVVLAGAQESASGRGPVRAGPGQIITVNPGEVHDGVPVGGAARRWRMLYFRPDILAAAFADLDISTGAELAFPVLDRPAAARRFLALHAALRLPEPTALAVDGLLLAVLAELSAPARRLPVPAADAVAPALARLDADPAGAVRLDALARLCGLSAWHFLRAFRAATGLPPHAYQVQRRVQLGRRLVLADTPLAEAAVAAGFADQPHFTRHFVSAYGYTPGRLARG